MNSNDDIRTWRKTVNRRLGELQAARAEVTAATAALEEAGERQESLKGALVVAQAVAQEVQERAHRQIADVVSRSLEAVFDEPYCFKIKFEQKRGRTEASLVFDREGEEVDPMTASGGGVIDVASFALRISCLMLSRPPLRRLIVADEPFRFVSAEYRPRVRALVETLAKEMDCQFVIVTHQEEMKMGTVVEVTS